MKFFLSVLFTIGIFQTTITAQDKAKLRIGGKLGINLATYGGSDADRTVGASEVESTTRVRMVFAGFAQFHLANCLYFQPELGLLNGKGVTYKLNGVDNGGFQYNYLELSTLLRAEIPVGGQSYRIQPYLLAGPSVGLMVTAKEFNVNGEISSIDKNEFNKIDISINGGVGAAITLSKGSVFLEGRYQLGISKINKEEDELDLKHRVASFLIGYQYPLR